jgi:hypothetical protein
MNKMDYKIIKLENYEKNDVRLTHIWFSIGLQ